MKSRAGSQLNQLDDHCWPRHTLMTADAVGGVWTYALELAQALAPHGIEITLATMGPRANARQRYDAAQVSNLTLVESDFKLEWMDDPWHDVAEAGEWLSVLEENVQPDIVHLNGYSHAALEWNCPVMVVAHSCVLSWWRAVKQTALPADLQKYEMHVARGLRAANLVVAPSRAMAGALQHHYGTSSRAEVIYNAADTGKFVAGHKEPCVFAAGRLWDEAKNIRSLIKAASDVFWPVVVAGDVQTSGGTAIVSSNVQHLGKLSREETAAQMARSSIYAFPARYEPFGLSVLEAALSGCALVLGDIPSLREIWGLAAVYVNPDDSQQLAAAINDLIVEPTRRMALARAARDRALRFSPQRMADQYLAAYRSLIESRVNQRLRKNRRQLSGVPTCAS